MDKKFTAWLLIVASLALLYISFNRPDRNKLNQLNQAQSPAENNAGDSAGGGITDTSDVAKVSPAPNAVNSGPTTWHNLGSLDPKLGFKLLGTFCSKGAGIVRVELVEASKAGSFRYESLEGVGAYVGFLALSPTQNGMTIGCVPDGSPAAKAQNPSHPTGLQINDEILEVEGTAIVSESDWFHAFKKRKPGESVDIKIRRPGQAGASAQEITYHLDTIKPPMDAVRMVDDQLNDQVVGNKMRESCLTTLSQLDGLRISAGASTIKGLESTLSGNWQAKDLPVEQGMGIEFTMPIQIEVGGKSISMELVKRYRIRQSHEGSPKWDGYEIDLQTICRNLDKVPHRIGFRQETFNGVTVEGWWYLSKIGPHFFGGAGARDVVYASKYQGHQMLTRPTVFAAAKENPQVPEMVYLNASEQADRRDLKYVGVDAQFFAAAMLPSSQDPEAMRDIQQAAAVSYVDATKIGARQQASNLGSWFETPIVNLEPNQELSKQYTLFVGPKHKDLLAKYGLSRLLGYGWFGWVAKPLTEILHFFRSISQNFGIAIIMLTVLVRSCMFPISRRAALNAQKMQELAPEMKRINELYKDDLAKRTQATQELYKKSNFKPLAGCIPVFFQIPIFIGLYRAVSVDIELRQQSLVPGWHWCSNLAGPDMMLDWSTWMPEVIAGKGVGWFGPYLNLLPIITVTLFIIQQKVLMPKATDEQQQATQTMMMWMTVFMGVLFFKVPAGLCLYFITSSIWSLVERNLVKRLTPPPKPPEASTTATPEPKPTPSTSVRPLAETNKPRPRTKAQARPEKLSDVLPWFKRFEKSDASESSEESDRKGISKRKGSDRKKKK